MDSQVQRLGGVSGEVTAVGGAQSTAIVVCANGDAFLMSDQGITKRRVDGGMYACEETSDGRAVLGGATGKLLFVDVNESGLVEDSLAAHGICKPGRNIHGFYSSGDALFILGRNSLLVEVRRGQWRELLAPSKSSERQYVLFNGVVSQGALYVAGLFGIEPFVGRVESGEIVMLRLPESLEGAPILSVVGEELFLLGGAAWRWSESQWRLASGTAKSGFVGAIPWEGDLLAGRGNGALVRVGQQYSAPVKMAGWPM